MTKKKKKVKKVVKKESENSMILVISDLHLPYEHPDSIDFLRGLTEAYSPDRVILMGDEVDSHALSYHESNPDLDSAGVEFSKALAKMEDLYEIWDGIKVDIIDSNHGALGRRKAQTAGIPSKFLKQSEDLFDAPSNWDWHDDLIITMSNGQKCLFTHGKSAEIMKVVSSWSICTVQGHYHCRAKVEYLSNPEELLWGLQTGCSIDRSHPAFAYDKNGVKRPIISHALIENGLPILIPMPLVKGGRWNRKIP